MPPKNNRAAKAADKSKQAVKQKARHDRCWSRIALSIRLAPLLPAAGTSQLLSVRGVSAEQVSKLSKAEQVDVGRR